MWCRNPSPHYATRCRCVPWHLIKITLIPVLGQDGPSMVRHRWDTSAPHLTHRRLCCIEHFQLGIDGSAHSGSRGATIRVWSGMDLIASPNVAVPRWCHWSRMSAVRCLLGCFVGQCTCGNLQAGCGHTLVLQCSIRRTLHRMPQKTTTTGKQYCSLC
jgi:hypothetical protein